MAKVLIINRAGRTLKRGISHAVATFQRDEFVNPLSDNPDTYLATYQKTGIVIDGALVTIERQTAPEPDRFWRFSMGDI